ncbi:DUF3572 domain-containing protein [Oceanibacterium hippocampi]|uniref:DUF3572 domain-containing protein n=1 Tax=Oceanibacterium hippocampi TaxID=745714 RepID=A0A1Y5SN10_9PROT|nr:DUF3572 domain-containing protein [Oceanibacterium hippocampi]SLN43848.1 hypothetical protein OCH7691_01839 [Oceanibacterium hippocampi]
MKAEEAETIAIRALAFIASDPEALNGFLRMTGIAPETLAPRAGDPEILGGVLDFLLGNESRLLAFSESEGLDPRLPAAARRALPGADIGDEWSGA